jgi:hypothetical protein
MTSPPAVSAPGSPSSHAEDEDGPGRVVALDADPPGPPLAAGARLLACGRRPLDVVPATDDALARIAMDYATEVGDLAPAALLGRWADGLDRTRPEHRRVWRAVVAAAAFALAPGWGRTAFRSWFRDHPRPNAAARAPFVAVAETPFVPWRVADAGPRGLTLRPRVALAAWWVPSEPVDPDGLGWLERPPTTGDTVFARLVPTRAGGAVLRTALVLPVADDDARLRGVLMRLAGAMRSVNAAYRREDLYRRAGHRVLAGLLADPD